MSIESYLCELPKSGAVYLSPIPDDIAPQWGDFQLREKAFWQHKITQTDYKPDPVSNFKPFLGHWQIAPKFFKNQAVLEIGTGPFGFFAAIDMMDSDCVPKELALMDPLMDFYQQFDLFNYMPDKSLRLQAPGENIPFPDDLFDCIVTTNTIDHVADCDTFLQEVGRVLKKDGILLFSVHTLANFVKPLKPIIKHLDKNHPYHFNRDDVTALFAKNGFTLTQNVSVPMHKENFIPADASIKQKAVYAVGFRIMNTLYGTACLNKK
jgi:SAM-dependent methyltransferase